VIVIPGKLATAGATGNPGILKTSGLPAFAGNHGGESTNFFCELLGQDTGAHCPFSRYFRELNLTEDRLKARMAQALP
jgi:hypothetical protein